MTFDSLLSPMPILFITVFAAFFVARRLSGGGTGADVEVRLRLTKLEADVKRLQQAAGQTTDAAGDDDVRLVARTEGTISAIKLVRARTGMGLKEAKEHVEALLAGNSPDKG
jgi:hypothetical protein